MTSYELQAGSRLFFYESRGGKEVVGEARIIEVGSGTVDEVLARFGDDLFLTRPERGSQRVEELWENPEVVNKCMVLCKECFSRIDSIGCEEGIRKEGFVFVPCESLPCSPTRMGCWKPPV